MISCLGLGGGINYRFGDGGKFFFVWVGGGYGFWVYFFLLRTVIKAILNNRYRFVLPPSKT